MIEGAAVSLRPRARRANADINITPFVDVMLVLLIIFMVAAPLMQQGIDVDLPETSTQALRVQDNPLILSVKKDGTYFLGKSEIQIASLEGNLFARRQSRAVWDRRQSHGGSA